MAAPFNFFKKYWPALVIGLIGIGLAIALPLLGVFAPFVGLGVLGIAAASGILLGITLVAVALVALTIWGISKYRENRAANYTEPKVTPTPTPTPDEATKDQATQVANFIKENLFLQAVGTTSNKLGTLGSTEISSGTITFTLDSNIVGLIADDAMEKLAGQIKTNYDLRNVVASKSTLIISRLDVAKMASQIPTDTIFTAPPTTAATTTTTASPATATATIATTPVASKIPSASPATATATTTATTTTASPATTTTTTTPPPKPPVVTTQKEAKRVRQTILDLCKADKEFGISNNELVETFAKRPDVLIVSKVAGTENYQVSLSTTFSGFKSQSVFGVNKDLDPYSDDPDIIDFFHKEGMREYNQELQKLVDAIDTKWGKGTATPTADYLTLLGNRNLYNYGYGFQISPEAIQNNILPKLGPAEAETVTPATPTITTTTTTATPATTITTEVDKVDIDAKPETPTITATTTTTAPATTMTTEADKMDTDAKPETPTIATIISTEADAQRVLNYIQDLVAKDPKFDDINHLKSPLKVTPIKGSTNYQITLETPEDSTLYDRKAPEWTRKNEPNPFYDSDYANMGMTLYPKSMERIAKAIDDKWGKGTTNRVSDRVELGKGDDKDPYDYYAYKYNIEIPPQKIREILSQIPQPTEGLTATTTEQPNIPEIVRADASPLAPPRTTTTPVTLNEDNKEKETPPSGISKTNT